MTKEERAQLLPMCIGGGLITYAGYLASTAGDAGLALALLTIGMIPSIAHAVQELKIGLIKGVLVGVALTVAVPIYMVFLVFMLGLEWFDDMRWLLDPALHWGTIVVTGLVGISYSIVFVMIVIQEIIESSKSNRHLSLI